jgi:hypothetical protein
LQKKIIILLFVIKLSLGKQTIIANNNERTVAAFSFVATGEESTRHELRPIFQLALFTPTQGKNAILYKESRYSLCAYLFCVFALLRIFHGSWGPCSLDIDGLD